MVAVLEDSEDQDAARGDSGQQETYEDRIQRIDKDVDYE
jgi:hypothetical protein